MRGVFRQLFQPAQSAQSAQPSQAPSVQTAIATHASPSPLPKLPTEIWLNVLDFLTGPYVQIIHTTANNAQQKNVIATRKTEDGSNKEIPLIDAYHLLVTYDAKGESITSVKIGFCKKNESGRFVYETHEVDSKSSLYRYVTERPLNFNNEGAVTESQDLLFFKYLIPEIKKAGGLTKHPMHDLLQFAKANPRLHNQLLSSTYGRGHPMMKYPLKMLLHHQAYHEVDSFRRILNSHPVFLDPIYTGDVADTSLARTWQKASVISLALAHRQKFIFEEIIKALSNPSRLSEQQRAELKAKLLAQCSAWDYPCYFIVGKKEEFDEQELANLDKGIYFYRKNDKVYALVVHAKPTVIARSSSGETISFPAETIDLAQCFIQQDLTPQRAQEELAKIEWPEESIVPHIVRAQSPLPTIIAEAIFDNMEHPNGLEYTQDNLLAQGVRILDANYLANNPAEKTRYEQEVLTHNGYHVIIKMNPGNPDQGQQTSVVSCELGLRDPVTRGYLRIAVPAIDSLYDRAAVLYQQLQESKDQFGNRFSHYVTRDQRNLLVVEKFLKTQHIERNLKGNNSRVNLFSLWCGSQNHVDRWQAWHSGQREFDNLHTIIYKLLRSAPAEFLQVWLVIPWWESSSSIEKFVQSWSPDSTRACVNFDSSSLHPLSVFLGAKNYASGRPRPRAPASLASRAVRHAGWGRDRQAASGMASNSFLEAETQALRSLNLTLKAS